MNIARATIRKVVLNLKLELPLIIKKPSNCF